MDRDYSRAPAQQGEPDHIAASDGSVIADENTVFTIVKIRWMASGELIRGVKDLGEASVNRKIRQFDFDMHNGLIKGVPEPRFRNARNYEYYRLNFGNTYLPCRSDFTLDDFGIQKGGELLLVRCLEGRQISDGTHRRAKCRSSERTRARRRWVPMAKARVGAIPDEAGSAGEDGFPRAYHGYTVVHDRPTRGERGVRNTVERTCNQQ